MIRSILLSACIILSLSLGQHAQTMIKDKASQLTIRHTPKDFLISDLNNSSWNAAEEITVGTYWSGVQAPAGRHFTVKLLWSNTALYVRFEAVQTEPLVISKKPDLAVKTMGLWDRDVCEIFIAPNKAEPRKYFEFEIAPTGEWIDLGLHTLTDKRETDWDYHSEMASSARIERTKVTMAIKVPWKALERTPKAGDTWLGNLFRCVGEGKDRGYLAWQPTLTAEPSFHVPEKFGQFAFTK